MLQCQLDHFPRIHAGSGQCSAEQLVEADHPVPGVEQQQGEHLVWVVLQQGLQVGEHALRVAQRTALGQPFTG
ncbi:hypothetical protein D3C84_1066080 [compost metagenome]